MTTCSTDSLKLRSSQATDFRVTQFSLLPTRLLPISKDQPKETMHWNLRNRFLLPFAKVNKVVFLCLFQTPSNRSKTMCLLTTPKFYPCSGTASFGGGPPPVSLCSLRNFDRSFFAVLCRFVHFSLTIATLRCVVPTAFTAIVTSSNTLCLNLLAVVLVNFDFSTACFSSNFWVFVAVSCTEKFGFRFLQAF